MTGPGRPQLGEPLDVEVHDMRDGRIVHRHVGPVRMPGHGHEVELERGLGQRIGKEPCP